MQWEYGDVESKSKKVLGIYFYTASLFIIFTLMHFHSMLKRFNYQGNFFMGIYCSLGATAVITS